MSNFEDVGQIRRSRGISMKIRTKEHALKLASVIEWEVDIECTNRQMAENIMIRLKCIRFAIPNAKQRIMHSTPVLVELSV